MSATCATAVHAPLTPVGQQPTCCGYPVPAPPPANPTAGPFVGYRMTEDAVRQIAWHVIGNALIAGAAEPDRSPNSGGPADVLAALDAAGLRIIRA